MGIGTPRVGGVDYRDCGTVVGFVKTHYTSAGQEPTAKAAKNPHELIGPVKR